jgi:hypothetical protein
MEQIILKVVSLFVHTGVRRLQELAPASQEARPRQAGQEKMICTCHRYQKENAKMQMSTFLGLSWRKNQQKKL